MLIIILVFISVRSSSQTPFACTGSDGFGYYASSATNTQNSGVLTYSSSRLSKITTSTGQRTTLCEANDIGVAINALAFNPHDNFLYAVSRYDAADFSGKLYKIGENCEKVEIPVTGTIIKYTTNNTTTIDIQGGNIGSGTFDLDNNYYVNTSYTNSATTGFTNRLQKIEIVNNTAVVKSTVTLTCPSCTGTTRLRVTDIIFDEATGLLLGSNRETNKLYSINPATGVLTERGLTGITSAILGIYKNRDGNVRAISETGTIYSVNTTTGAFTMPITASTLGSGNADAASGCYAPPMISGFLFIDANGLSDGTVNGTGTDKAGTTIMYANLIQNGIVIKSDVLTTAGYYQFLGLFSGTYEVQISSVRGTIGQAPSQMLPSNYQWVGDNIGAGSGSDGSPNGRLTVTISAGQDRDNINFGIDAAPVSEGFTTQIQDNPNGTVQVVVPTLMISDPEESGINNITIQSIPDPTTTGTLYYNGVAVVANQYIASYDPALLTVDPVDGDVTVTFVYFTTDMAGLVSNASTVNIPFEAVFLPVVLVSFDGRSEAGVNTLQWITASEVNSDHFVIERKGEHEQFEEIGVISSVGNSTDYTKYAFTDKHPLVLSYYRLVQVDVDGSSDLSAVIVVSREVESGISLYPSTAMDRIFLEVDGPVDQLFEYSIFDQSGMLLRSGRTSGGVTEIDIEDLDAGFYFVETVSTAGARMTLRFAKSM